MKKMVLDAGLHVDIQVDGGINRQTLPAVLEAGANVIVAGSSVFGGNIQENVQELMEVMGECEAE